MPEHSTLDGTGKVPMTQLPDGLGGSVAWDAVTGKPATFPPATHAHAAADVTGTAVLTNDARLSDARIPTAHGNAQHTSTFLTATGTPDGSKFLRDDLTWQAVPGGGLTHPQVLARSLGA